MWPNFGVANTARRDCCNLLELLARALGRWPVWATALTVFVRAIIPASQVSFRSTSCMEQPCCPRVPEKTCDAGLDQDLGRISQSLHRQADKSMGHAADGAADP